jgi:TM2 domain-containing membrane protein YozV
MSFRAQKKDRTVALLLSLFLGGLGIDRMYVGDLGLGICKLLFNWATCFLWAFVDLFLIMGAADRHNMAVIDRLVAMYRAPTS